MKKHLFLSLIALCGAFYGRAQWVTIPDSNFVALLTQQYPGCMNGNQMDTTCPAIISETQLFCSHAQIFDLTGLQYFDSLKILHCEGNIGLTLLPLPAGLEELYAADNLFDFSSVNLPSGLVLWDCSQNYGPLPALPTSLRILTCNNMGLTTLPVLPDSLQELYANQNQLDTLPDVLPATLEILVCHINNISTIPTLPASLKTLGCFGNNLSSLPSLPNGLIALSCASNLLTAMPALPDSLITLDCRFNILTSLPALPQRLSYLDCGNNLLSALPALPIALQNLICPHDSLTSLPALPAGLTQIDASFNKITTLPVLPAGLKNLSINSNRLTNLPPLPTGLKGLGCSENQISSLPPFPSTLNSITCAGNLISSLPELPDTLELLYCGFNPNLYCLPQLKHINYLSIDTSRIRCLPNYGYVAHTVPNSNMLDALPLCDLYNNNGCPRYWNITGEVFNDANNSCSRNTTETRLNNTKVMLYQNNILVQQTYTYDYGLYSFDTDLGTYAVTLDTASFPFTITCPGTGSIPTAVTPLDSMLFAKNFAVKCKTGFDIGVFSIATKDIFRPAGFSYIQLKAGDLATYYNQTCNTSGVGGSLTLNLTGPITFAYPAQGALTPSVNGSTITYNIANWAAVNPEEDFNFFVQTNAQAQLNQQVCINASIIPATDNYAANNALSMCYTTVSSYDPNDKQVWPTGTIDTAARWLTYTIRFQNTGTAPAIHIYVEDTLSQQLDIASFELLNYSHKPFLQLYSTDNRLRFNFPNINLADSLHNEPDSHGYIQYRIRNKPGLQCGDSIKGPAYIYFDFNTPVVTNAPLTLIQNFDRITHQHDICNGQSFVFYGQTLTTSGIYTDTIQTPQTCDSIITLNLRVLQNSNTTIDTSILQGSNYTLPSGLATNIPGTYNDTLQNSNGCDSIITTNLSVINSIANLNNNTYLQLSPNPTHSVVNLTVSSNLLGNDFVLTNVLGQIITIGRLQQNITAINTTNLSPGLYLVRVGSIVKRLVKE